MNFAVSTRNPSPNILLGRPRINGFLELGYKAYIKILWGTPLRALAGDIPIFYSGV
jgi:hypothetical protein